MTMESEKRCASSSSSSSCAWEADRLVKTEIEAAETLADLAHLAMRETASDSGDKWCKKGKRGRRPFKPTPHSASNPAHSVSPSPDLAWEFRNSLILRQGQAVAGQQLDEKISTSASVETKRIQQDICIRRRKVEQDAELPKTSSACMTSYSLVRSSKSRHNLTEEEKEARRIRRVLANRESARQTIRRRQALCEELTRKAAILVLENENLKREKELALKEYQSLETTNKHLKAQIAKSINTEVEKTPAEHESSLAELTTSSGDSPWFLYNHFPVTQLFWPSVIQSSNPVQLQRMPLNSIAIPSNVSVPRSSESDSCHKQNNHINDNQAQNPLYMFPCPWIFPLPEFGNGLPTPSVGLKDKQDELPLGKQCNTGSSLNTVSNMDYQAALPIKLKTETSGLIEARPINDHGHATARCPLDRREQTAGCNTVEKLCGTALDGIGHASPGKQKHELQFHSAPNSKVSSAASHIANSSLEKKQERVTCPDKNLVDAVAAAEARKRRKELTKLKSIHGRQSRMHC